MILKLIHRLRNKKTDLTGLGIIALSATAVTGLLLLFRSLGGLEPLELRIFDQMVMQKPDEGPDPRLLVVAITEEDIQTLKQSTITDETLAESLEKLQQYQPAVIGLDIYRDIAQGSGKEKLEEQLKKPNIIAIAKMGITGNFEVPPPPSVPPERIGFNDLLQDVDGVVRRNLLFGNLNAETTLFSFALQVVGAYLTPQGIQPENSQANADLIHWGKAQFLPLQPSSGGYDKLDASGYQILLNYRSRRNVAKQVSLTELLNNQINPQWVKDKIVLIGYTAPTKRDLFLTPYSPAEKQDPKMAGVLIHAQMTSQILSVVLGENRLFWFWSEGGEFLWIVVWAVAGGTVAWFVHHPLALACSNIGMVAIIFGTGYYLFLRNAWIPIGTPVLATVTSTALVVTYRAYQAQYQHQIVMKLLGQNTSPEVADALWKNRDKLIKSGKLPGQKLIATMLFTDLKDFSTISEQMSPEALMEWLNEYLEILATTVQKNKGIINKFTGDGIMAAFGVPVERTTEKEIAEDAHHAVNCGLEFGERLKEINKEWQKRGLPVVQMRVGIFTGPVVVGSLGGKDRQEYGIIGDSVNIASRLESCEKDRQTSICRVLIAKETLVYIEPHYLVETWGHLALKGKHQTVDVYRVISKKSPPANS
ncbi:adenylate/guanylate cyclase domain-containing protein [Ancylothrix sp. D3o]|uniref:CHASE2 domain-containing protein n=1 Tax=Ancylothrix sp. D3o TaxID=2953691 RepID=UPI0021BA713C|nr:adenylate/guanylate cyclase domain-containing protein [Ancylothrix sp. D3o]